MRIWIVFGFVALYDSTKRKKNYSLTLVSEGGKRILSQTSLTNSVRIWNRHYNNGNHIKCTKSWKLIYAQHFMPLNKWWKSFHIFNSTRSEPQTPLNTAVAHCAHDRMWLYSIHRTVLCKMRSSEISLWWFPWLSSSRIFIRHWQTWRRTQKKICRKHFLLHNVNMCVVRFPPNQRKKRQQTHPMFCDKH